MVIGIIGVGVVGSAIKKELRLTNKNPNPNKEREVDLLAKKQLRAEAKKPGRYTSKA